MYGTIYGTHRHRHRTDTGHRTYTDVLIFLTYCTFDLNSPPLHWGQIPRNPWWANHHISYLVALTSLMFELVNTTIKYAMAPLEVGPEFAPN